MNYFNFVILFNFINLINKANGQSHAFIQVDNELKYLVDGVPVSMSEVLNVGENEHGFENIYDERSISKNYLIFDPPFLDFKEHPTGMPLMKKVFIQNTSPDISIHLHSLSGNTMHFHCTFFQDKVITPGSNTSFDVVFLGREEGFIENTIYVHTSIGTYRYWVKAVGSANPYRVRPLIGVRMPLNSSFTPVLHVHNPHSENLQIKARNKTSKLFRRLKMVRRIVGCLVECQNKLKDLDTHEKCAIQRKCNARSSLYYAVTEMYSTGGDLHLELTNDVQDADVEHWNIAPYHTKALMKATFVARRENNHTAYIRIVPGEPVSDYMVIPIEVEVSGEQGLFFPSDTLHFGLLTPHDPPISVPLYLLNSAPKHIHIQNIITSSVNEAITIDFKPVKIPPGTVHPTKVATVTFDPSKVTSGVKVSGKLLVKSKVSAYKLSVPFSVDLHQGSLLYNSSVTRFYSGSDPVINSTIATLMSSSLGTKTSTSSILGRSTLSAATSTLSPIRVSTVATASPIPKYNNDPHDLILKNTFKFPIVVHNITIPDETIPHFKVKWDGPVIIRQDESKKVAELSLLSAGSDIRLTIEITVHTNITSINIPLIAYNGKLTKYIPPTGKDNWLDFGTLGMGEQHDNYFYILNENPVDIRLKGWGSTLSHSAVELMGIVAGNFSDISRSPNNITYSSKSLFLKPNHYAVFRIGILTPDSEGIFIAESFVQTQYEVITLPFRLRTAEGLLSIFPDTILLEDAFPGKVSEQDLRILSTFGHSMTVESISPRSPDPRFSYVTIDSCTPQPILNPGVQSNVGIIVFNPKATCGEECYTGFSLYSKAGQQWASTFPLTSHAIDTDSSFLSVHRERYKKLLSHSFNMSLFLDTSEVKGHKFNAKVNLIWPSFVNIHQMKFPLTQVFNTSYKDFKLANPSSQPVITQVLFLHEYPSSQSVVTLLEEQLGYSKNISWDESGNVESFREVFSFLDLDHGSSCGEGTSHTHCSLEHANVGHLSDSFTQYRRSFEAEFKTRIAKDSLVLLLEPHSQVKIRLSFTPIDERNYSTLILIRNNLTVIEALSVEGSGGRGHINFKKTFSKSPSYFHFSIQEKNLKNCSLPSRMSQEQSSLYTLRQTFLAENDGLLPVNIYGLNIGDVPCQSYGFRVINCTSFLLMPNESRKIEIAFTPDFSLFHVEQHLVVFTSLTGIASQLRKKENMTIHPNGNLYLKLVATISPHAVSKCGEKIPRPPWEPVLYYSIVTLLVAMFLGTLVRAFLEAEHILKISFVPMTTVVPVDEPIPIFDRSKVFDLQAIGQQDSESIVNDSTSDSGNSDNSRSNTSFVKIKNHLNSLDHLKKPQNNLYNLNKTKVSKTFSVGTDSYANAENKNSVCMNNFSNKKSEYNNNKRGIKMSLGTFLSSLPFGLKGNIASTNSYSTNITNKNNTNTSTSNYLKGRKNSQRESEQQHIYISGNQEKLKAEEEFSSTTTESSSVDDLCIYLKDHYLNSYEEKPRKRKNSKPNFTSNFSESCFPVKTSPNQNEDTGFEITTKCKGIRKIKETSSKKHSNTIELPYTLKPVKIIDNEDEKEKSSSKIKNKQKRLVNEKNIGLARQKREELSNSPESEKKLPARAVIAPSSRPAPSNQPLAPRDPSYSSIVLGSSKQKSKVTPVGKILPEVKRVEKPLGAIGEKLPQNGGSVYHSGIKPLMGPSPIVNTPSSYSPQDSLHSHNPYITSLQPPSPHVSGHSWDPKTLSSPSIPGLGLESIRSNVAMSEDDWLPFGGPNFSSFLWGDVDSGIREKPAPSPPSPSFRDSLPSFNIWASPWNTDQTPLGSSILSPTRSLWHKDFGQTQPTNSYDIGSRINQVGSFDSLRSPDLNLSNTDKKNLIDDKHP